jgi:hypothetical protein
VTDGFGERVTEIARQVAKDVRGNGEHADASYLLKVVHPGLLGLMDGSISTLAPLFATVFATHNARVAFLVGAAAAVGPGISISFSEALSDTGEQTGRGHPFARGVITDVVTLIGGMMHTLPFLISRLAVALPLAYAVVGTALMRSRSSATASST